MLREFPALHLPVAYDDITKQLANDYNHYKFSICPYSVLQEFAVEIEVIVTSHFEVVRELHIWCTSSSKVLKRFASITDQLDISWDPGNGSVFNGDESLLLVVCVLFELLSTAVDPSWKPVPPQPPWLRSDANAGSSTSTIALLRWYVWRDSSVWPNHAWHLPSPHSPEMNAFKPRKMMGIALVSLVVVLFYLFSLTSDVIGNFLVCEPI